MTIEPANLLFIATYNIVPISLDSLYSIPWDFSTFPSQEFKNQLGSYLLEYAQGNMTWDDVVKQTTDCWASEKALLAQ